MRLPVICCGKELWQGALAGVYRGEERQSILTANVSVLHSFANAPLEYCGVSVVMAPARHSISVDSSILRALRPVSIPLRVI